MARSNQNGDSGTLLAKKLGIVAGTRVLLRHPPAHDDNLGVMAREVVARVD